MTGAWTLTDDGEFVLDPAFDARLKEIKERLRDRWLETICDELAASTGYSREDLLDSFVVKIQDVDPKAATVDTVDEFIIQALEGDL